MWNDLSFPTLSRRSSGTATTAPADNQPPPFLRGARAFILHYIRAKALQFGILLVMVVGAASCAVAVQYVMKLLVDAMAGPRLGNDAAWMALSLFIGLTAMESVLWRISGWMC